MALSVLQNGKIPQFLTEDQLQLFQPSAAPLLRRRKLVHILKPKFSEDGSNQRQFENQSYAAFCKYPGAYLVMATDEEPILGFETELSITFVTDGTW